MQHAGPQYTDLAAFLQKTAVLGNALAPFMPGVGLAEHADNGVARITVGGALAGKVRAATKTLASEMLELAR